MTYVHLRQHCLHTTILRLTVDVIAVAHIVLAIIYYGRHAKKFAHKQIHLYKKCVTLTIAEIRLYSQESNHFPVVIS